MRQSESAKGMTVVFKGVGAGIGSISFVCGSFGRSILLQASELRPGHWSGITDIYIYLYMDSSDARDLRRTTESDRLQFRSTVQAERSGGPKRPRTLLSFAEFRKRCSTGILSLDGTPSQGSRKLRYVCLLIANTRYSSYFGRSQQVAARAQNSSSFTLYSRI
jgi:hypothetical protein